MSATYTCIICPKGCDIEAETDGVTILSMTGNLCARGREYLLQELRDPRRTLASSVLVDGGEFPLVSVRLSAPVPRDKIFDVMAVVRGLRVTAPVRQGDVLAADVLGLGCDVLATRHVRAPAPCRKPICE